MPRSWPRRSGQLTRTPCAGPLLKLNQWVMDLSPFAHLPKLPGAPVNLTPIITLTCVTALLTAVGLTGFRRRDLG
jgi:ABC-2 type transport system permease protein